MCQAERNELRKDAVRARPGNRGHGALIPEKAVVIENRNPQDARVAEIAGVAAQELDRSTTRSWRTYRFADLVCRIAGDEGLLAGMANQLASWGDFVADSEAAPDVSLDVAVSVNPRVAAESEVLWQALPPVPEHKGVKTAWVGDSGLVVCAGALALYEPRCQSLHIALRDATLVANVPVILRVALLSALSELGGLAVHGCGATQRGAAVLFTGVSGGGKSTVAELIGPQVECVLSDEAVLLRPTQPGWTAYGTPFSGMPEVGANASGRLAAVLTLKKASAFQLRRLQGRAAASALLKVAISMDDCPVRSGQVAANAMRLLEEVPLYELAFAPRPEVWPFVRDRLKAEGVMCS